ncbi:hypothetical protein KQX54_014341 [Cotesia glomerata]|uniref:Chitin-binding type-2 domain-containing protein n=1 Tax=Cotesia glomerata TaxID=32391 RepID=A0AAV7J8D3_COTGL|nr:hypothetical protein KQX54_014341 [Cotesia glomerata]
MLVLENAWDDTGFGKVDEEKKSHYDLQNVKLNSNEQAETFIDNSSAQIVSNVRQSYPEISDLNANQFEQTAIPNLLAESDQARPDDDQMLIPGCLATRGQFPSPNNCANYLNCWENTVIEQQCPNDLLFNEMTGLCDFEQNVNCGERPGPTPSKFFDLLMLK